MRDRQTLSVTLLHDFPPAPRTASRETARLMDSGKAASENASRFELRGVLNLSFGEEFIGEGEKKQPVTLFRPVPTFSMVK